MAATRDQSDVRWRNDDGSETTATWAAAQNASFSGNTNTNYRLRLMSALGGVGTITWTPKLQYNKNSAGWNDVNGSSLVARSSLSPNITDNANTTAQLSAGDGFTAGQFDETDGTVSNSVTLSDTGSLLTEHEFSIQIRSADTVGGDSIQFRLVTSGGGTYTTYTNLGLFLVGGGYDNGQFLDFFD